jgi:hypothetical protein
MFRSARPAGDPPSLACMCPTRLPGSGLRSTIRTDGHSGSPSSRRGAAGGRDQPKAATINRVRDYQALEREFITGGMSLRELCRAHGITAHSAALSRRDRAAGRGSAGPTVPAPRRRASSTGPTVPPSARPRARFVLANRTIIGAFDARRVVLRAPDPTPLPLLRLPKHVRYRCAPPRRLVLGSRMGFPSVVQKHSPHRSHETDDQEVSRW